MTDTQRLTDSPANTTSEGSTSSSTPQYTEQQLQQIAYTQEVVAISRDFNVSVQQAQDIYEDTRGTY